MAEFRLPDVGEGLHEAELLEWVVAVGDEVREGDVVAVVNTEKVTVDLPSPIDGRVSELPWEVGDVIQVGEVLVRFEGTPAVDSPPGAPATQAAPVNGSLSSSEAAPSPVRRSPERSEPGIAGADLGVVVAAPSTRRLAAEKGIDLRELAGSGPGGRVVRSDVLAAPSAEPSPSAPLTSGSRSLTGLRALSARNLERSRAVAVTCTTTFEVRADGLVELLDELRDVEPRVTLPAVVAVCAAHTLSAHPWLNGYLVDDGNTLSLKTEVDVAVAVATEHGLTVPVLRDVAARRLLHVASDLHDLAQRARENRLQADELRGGTFTVSSTGALESDGVISTTPVINHPQITTLWVGRIQPIPRVAADGSLEVGPVLRASLSFDHRFVDGAEATRFIGDLSKSLERPTTALA